MRLEQRERVEIRGSKCAWKTSQWNYQQVNFRVDSSRGVQSTEVSVRRIWESKGSTRGGAGSHVWRVQYEYAQSVRTEYEQMLVER